jgi:hypothetical protein
MVLERGHRESRSLRQGSKELVTSWSVTTMVLKGTSVSRWSVILTNKFVAPLSSIRRLRTSQIACCSQW